MSGRKCDLVCGGGNQDQQGGTHIDELGIGKIAGDYQMFDKEQRGGGSVLWWSSCHHLHVRESEQKSIPPFCPQLPCPGTQLSCRNILEPPAQQQQSQSEERLDICDSREVSAAWDEAPPGMGENTGETVVDCKASNTAWSSTADSIAGSVSAQDAFHEGYAVEGLRGLSVDTEGRSRYTLRSNPKRSWRLRDQEFCVEGGSAGSVVVAETFNVSFLSLPAIAPAAIVRKATASCKIAEEKPEKHTCTECGREFPSCKALFGHMRCHPEREWRGIQRPEGLSLQQRAGAGSGGDVRINADLQTSMHRKKARGKIDSSPVGIGEPSEDHDMIESLLMLARAGSGRHVEQVSSKGTLVGKMMEKQHEAHALNSKGRLEGSSKMKGKLVNECGAAQKPPSVRDGNMDGGESTRTSSTRWEGHPEDGGHSESDWSEADVHFTSTLGGRNVDLKLDGVIQSGNTLGKEQMMEAASGACVPSHHKYECLTCNIIFKSYQSLGGHRASHKKVKGCFARNHSKGGGCMSLNYAQDGLVNQDGMKSSDAIQKASDCQVASRCELKTKRCCVGVADVADDFERENFDKQQPTFAKKVDGCHECSVCHRVFASGPALGGHKRCHWGGAGVLEASGKASNSEQQPSVTPQDKEEQGFRNHSG